MPLEQLLTDTHPFGPEDQALIDSLTDAVDLTGLYGPLSTALAGNYILISGRKGCGKSAVISMLRGFELARGRLQREKIKIDDVHQRTTFITIKTWTEFLSMNVNVRRYLVDNSNYADRKVPDADFYELIPTEAVEKAWVNELWERIFQKFYDAIQGDGDLVGRRNADELRNVLLCFDDDAMAALRGTPEYIASKIFSAARREVESFLTKNDTSVCLLFDSLERYPLANPTFSLSMGGFLRAINTITAQNHRIKIVFALPEELLPYMRASSSNILKDFSRSFSMKWRPSDLWRIAAYRYRLFLSLHDPNFYKDMQLSASDWNNKRQLTEFFETIMPSTIVNGFNVEEPSKAYLIRHTFLVPRHLLLILNRTSLDAYSEHSHWRGFSASSIVRGVKTAEQDIADEIFVPFEGIYRGLKTSLNKVLGGLPPIFPYGELDKAISKTSKQFSLEDHEMIKLLFDMGVIGRIRGDTSEDETYKMYTLADFFFNLKGNISFSGGDILCFHPIFSTYYNADARRGGDKRIIYPYNISAEITA